MIPAAGSDRKDAGKSPYPAGTGRKALEKIRKFSGRNIASKKTPELPETGRFRARLFDLGMHDNRTIESYRPFISRE
jgi:hypothetical protein